LYSCRFFGEGGVWVGELFCELECVVESGVVIFDLARLSDFVYEEIRDMFNIECIEVILHSERD